MTTQLLSLEKEFLGIENVNDLPEDKYAKAGFHKAAKVIKAHRFGYRFCHRSQIQKWVDEAAGKFAASKMYKPTDINDPISKREGSVIAQINPAIRPYDNSMRWNDNIVVGTEISFGLDSRYLLAIEQCDVSEYDGIPPADVAEKVAEAKDKKIFDSLIVLYPTCKKIVDDPIVCGKIKGMPDIFFFIAGWAADLFSFAPKEQSEGSDGLTFGSMERMLQQMQAYRYGINPNLLFGTSASA